MRLGWKATVPVMAALAGLSLAATQGLAKETVEQPEKPVFATSLAGAFLAARTAEADNDFDDAIAFYQRALAFDPANETRPDRR